MRVGYTRDVWDCNEVTRIRWKEAPLIWCKGCWNVTTDYGDRECEDCAGINKYTGSTEYRKERACKLERVKEVRRKGGKEERPRL